MSWSIQPEPSDEAERQALLRALEQLLDEDDEQIGHAGAWWRSGLESLGSPTAEQSWRDPGVVEP